jgi:hypothetical protein
MINIDELTTKDLRVQIALRHGLKLTPTSMTEATAFGWERISEFQLHHNDYYWHITFYEGEPGEVYFVPPYKWKTINDFPNWPESNTEAILLLDKGTVYFELYKTVGVKKYGVTALGNYGDYVTYVEDTIALACCKAWLDIQIQKELRDGKPN